MYRVTEDRAPVYLEANAASQVVTELRAGDEVEFKKIFLPIQARQVLIMFW